MGVVGGLPPLEFTECLSDSPFFRVNLHMHERELEKTNQHIKRIIKEVKDLLSAAKQLSLAQRSFAKCLKGFTFECIGGIQTDDEQVICASLNNFSELILQVEDERDRMLDNACSLVLKPLEDFRKKYIGGVKNEKKKFEKQTAKFCQNQERYLNLTTKKPNSLQEADASVDMAERHFYTASMDYVYLIQEAHERKKFEFVETLLTFIYAWFTFYHQGYELKKDSEPYMKDLQQKLQKTRTNFDDFSQKLKKRMSEVQNQNQIPVRKAAKGCKEGYLFLLEKKAFGTTWTKHYCRYDKESKEFTMLPYNQLTTKSLPQPETMVLTSCVRRMSDSIEKRFCFDIQLDSKPGAVFTFQALSEQDRKAWMDIMDGKEPTYTTPALNPAVKIANAEERVLNDLGIQFVRRCIEVLESRGLEEQGIYRVVGVSSKVNKLLTMGLDRRKGGDRLNVDDPLEWETKTITSALKTYLRNLPEPLMTYRYHNGFIEAVKCESKQNRINDVHALLYRLPKTNFEVLKILMKHLTNVVSKCDKNLMTVSNLGVCFGPTLLRPEEETVASILDLKFYNIVVEILIDNYERVFFSEPPDARSNSNNVSTAQQQQSAYGLASNHVQPNYANADDSQRGYVNNGYQSARISSPSPGFKGYSQPYTCTVTSYIEAPISSSMYSVHEPSNGGYAMTRSEHGPAARLASAQQRLKHFAPPVTSQSETNLPNLHGYSPPGFKHFNRTNNADSSSSSNESLSSASRDGINFSGVTPKKSERSSLYTAYPKMHKSPGNVPAPDPLTLLTTSSNISKPLRTPLGKDKKDNDGSAMNASSTSTSSCRSSPIFGRVRRVRTLYACLGEHDGELSFEPNQIITNVKESQEPGWLEGTLNGKSGLIPKNYVEILP